MRLHRTLLESRLRSREFYVARGPGDRTQMRRLPGLSGESRVATLPTNPISWVVRFRLTCRPKGATLLGVELGHTIDDAKASGGQDSHVGGSLPSRLESEKVEFFNSSDPEGRLKVAQRFIAGY
jgi:hypothetical protein